MKEVHANLHNPQGKTGRSKGGTVTALAEALSTSTSLHPISFSIECKKSFEDLEKCQRSKCRELELAFFAVNIC